MVKINSKPNYIIFKEPRGFIKLIELFIAVFAFSALAAYAGFFHVFVTCFSIKSGKQFEGGLLMEVSYPFDEYKFFRNEDYCNDTGLGDHGVMSMSESYQSESQFFVFVGVIAFVYCLVMLGFYIYIEDQQEEASSTNVGMCSIPVVDFVFSAILVFFWFVSSCAWASAFTGVRDATTKDHVFKIINDCRHHSCRLVDPPTFGALYVSVLLGFLNVFVWIGNLWFLFKETPWHSPRRSPSDGPPPEQTFGQQQVPEAPSAAI